MIEIKAINYNGRSPTAELRGVFGPAGGTIGRGLDNTLTLPDPARHVSRVQASIRFDGSRYLISNVSSANPLFLNEEEVESGVERAIRPGDGLRVGLYQLMVGEATGVATVVAPKPGWEMSTVANPPGLSTGLATSNVDPLSSLGGSATGPNPFADLMGGVSPSSGPIAAPAAHPGPAHASTPVPPGDPFADLAPPPKPATANPPPPQIQSPQSLSGDPFSDLLQSTPSQASPSRSPSSSDPFSDLMQPSAPSAISADPGKAKFAGGIPDDFDAFALPSKVPRNSDDPLRDLAGASIGLNAVGGEEQKSNMLEFDLAKKADPKDLLQGGTPSMVDSLSAVDPLELFGGPDDGLLRGAKDPFAGSMPMRDNVPELGANFRPPRSLPEGPRPAEPSTPQETVVAPPLKRAPKEQLPSSSGNPVPPPPMPAAVPGPPAAAAPVAKDLPQAPEPSAEALPQAPAPIAKALPQAPASRPPETTPRPAPAQPPGPNQQSVKAGAATGSRTADHDALLAAFLKGAGVPNMAVPNGLTPEFMELMGTIVYKATAGAMELIAARQITKREVRAEMTMIVAQGNNPYKFMPTPEAAIMQMLGPKLPGFMLTADAMQDAFDDLRAHEVGVIAGMRAALGAVLKRFDPAVLEKRLGKGGLLEALVPNAREGKLWSLFTERFQEIVHEAEDDFQALFGQAFTKAYEEQVALDRERRKRA